MANSCSEISSQRRCLSAPGEPLALHYYSSMTVSCQPGNASRIASPANSWADPSCLLGNSGFCKHNSDLAPWRGGKARLWGPRGVDLFAWKKIGREAAPPAGDESDRAAPKVSVGETTPYFRRPLFPSVKSTTSIEITKPSKWHMARSHHSNLRANRLLIRAKSAQPQRAMAAFLRGSVVILSPASAAGRRGGTRRRQRSISCFPRATLGRDASTELLWCASVPPDSRIE